MLGRLRISYGGLSQLRRCIRTAVSAVPGKDKKKRAEEGVKDILATHLSVSPTAAAAERTPSSDALLKHHKKLKSSVRRAGSVDMAMEMFPGPSVACKKTFAYCTAEEYDLTNIAGLVNADPFLQLCDQITDDVLHLKVALPDETDSAAALAGSVQAPQPDPRAGDIFVFRGGSFVTWGFDEDTAKQFYSSVIKRQGVQIVPYKMIESEEMEYIEDDSEVTSLTEDVIKIGPTPPPSLSKLAFSHGLSRSAKLSILESLLDSYLDSTKHVPHLLAAGKDLGMDREEILKKIGELLSVRALLNLSGNVESLLDTPEYYWTHHQLEDYYRKVNAWLDIKPRIAVLNQKLDYAAEFAQVLRGHLSEKHSLKLEWMIILLISVEVVFEILHWGEKLGYLRFTHDDAADKERRIVIVLKEGANGQTSTLGQVEL
ncbi:hypothetical protein RI367_002196 [Sorochytrium milnesiophthora]